MDALGGKLILAVGLYFLSDVDRDFLEALSHLLPVLLGAHRARDELLQHAGGDRLLARSPLNEQGDPHGDGYPLREALVRHTTQAFRHLADNVDVGAH